MERLRSTIEQFSRWKALGDFIDRMEGHLETDFSVSVENAKALLESIGKEICKVKQVELSATSSVNAVLKNAFRALGYPGEDLVSQISGSLANIGHHLGNLRNEISPTSHGKPLDELRERNSKVDALTREFLMDSTVIVAMFMIRAFEERQDAVVLPDAKADKIEERLDYNECDDFNTLWDGVYGEFVMGDYSYPASEIFYNVDYRAYEAECLAFNEAELKAMFGEALEAGK